MGQCLLSKPYHPRLRGKKLDTMAHIWKMGGADRRMSPKHGVRLRDSLETRWRVRTDLWSSSDRHNHGMAHMVPLMLK